MDITNPQRAKVLVHALPYIQEYSGKIVVIKYGGNAMISAKLKDSVMRDIVLLSLIGVKVVLVHGGGPEITETLEKLGKQTQFVDGLRVTDAETADVVQMVLAGKINKTLVNLIGHKGGRAIGLSGIDGQMIQARVRDERLGYVGEITKVDVRPILDVIDKGYIPVVSTVGCDTQGHVYNINADTAAARIAGELGAESLIAMTDISGILRDKDDPSTLIPVIHTADALQLIESGVINGGMLPKVTCCIDAIRWGVHRVFIIDGRVPHAILIEMLTNEGIGTMFVAGQGGKQMNIPQLDSTYIANTYARFPVTIARGKGSLVWDADDKVYIDMATGIAVNSFGIADPAWIRAVTEQLCTVQHASNLYYTAPDAQLAQLLCEKTGMKKVFFSNSGAEANECAIKAARKYAADHKGPEYHTIITLKTASTAARSQRSPRPGRTCSTTTFCR